jgi:RHS repeat-associated protein
VALAGGIVNTTGEIHGTYSQLSNTSSSPLIAPLNSFLTNRDTSNAEKPRAYLNWILLDEEFNYVNSYPQSGAIPVGSADVLTALAQENIPITKNGYLYIYVSNETQNWDVFFDNLVVNHRTGPLVEETHYYPFGLTMAGISSKAFNILETRNKFNGIELSNDLDLGWYETICRVYDPQVGRFAQIDPLSFMSKSASPYVFGNNNPVKYNDPLGLISDPEHPQVLETVTVVGHKSHKPTFLEAIFGYIVNNLKGDHEKANKSIENNTIAKMVLFPLSTHTPFAPPNAMADATSVEELHEKQMKQYEEEAKLAMMSVPEIAAEEIVLELVITEAAEESAIVMEEAAVSGDAAAMESANLLPSTTLKITKHALQRMEQRGITKAMIKKAIEKGTKYFDPKNGTSVFVLEKAFASGKNLIVATNQITGAVITVERTTALNMLKRMFPW